MSLKVSIILSVFNGEDWIDKAIKNILSQKFQNYEFLIVNDGSNDSTEEKILNYQKINKHIKYLPKNHTGLTDSLNFALNKSLGTWIARIDVDDTSTQDRILKQINFVESNKKIVLLGSNFQVRKHKNIVYKSNLPSDNNRLIYRLKNMKGFFPHSSAFFLREKAIQVGGYRSAFKKSQDHDLWLRLSEVGEIACCNDYLVEINEHPKRITNMKTGWPQNLYAFTSITSHYLRLNNQRYLENKIKNNNLDETLIDLNNFLEKNNFYNVKFFKNKIKSLLQGNNKIKMIKNLIILCLSNKRIFFRALKMIIYGTNLPYKFYLTLKNED